MQNDNLKFKNFNIEIFLTLATLFFLPFYFIKFKYSWVSLNLVEILIIALAAVWIWGNRGDWENRKDWKKYQWPAALILIGVASSIFVNGNYYIELGIFKGWFLLPVVFAIVFYDGLKKNEKLLDWSLAALFSGGMLVAAEGIRYWFSGLLTFDGRLRIFFDSPNQLAMYLAPVLIIGAILFLREIGKSGAIWEIRRIIFGAGLMIVGINLYFTKSFGPWLALAATLFVVFWLAHKGKARRKIIILFPAILLIFVILSGSGKYESIKKLGDRSSLASREMIWKSAGLMIQKNPVFGIGPGNFQEKYLEYQKYFPPYLEWAVPQPHNLYLAFWLESGLMGIIGFFWLVKVFFADNKKAIRNNRLYGILCLAVMLYFLIHGLVDTTYWRNDMAIVFWAVIALDVYLAERSNQPSLERSL